MHPKTVARYAADKNAFANPDLIRSYRVEDEKLTQLQENSLFSHLGLIKPAVAGEKIDLTPQDASLSADERHAMDNVIASMEERKQNDEALLKGIL